MVEKLEPLESSQRQPLISRKPHPNLLFLALLDLLAFFFSKEFLVFFDRFSSLSQEFSAFRGEKNSLLFFCGFPYLFPKKHQFNPPIEEERRCTSRGGKASESLSEENCPLEALRVFFFFFSRNSHRKTSKRSS